MKTKSILLFFAATLLGICCLSAQQQKMFYYYKGDSITLNVNSQHFYVYADTNKVSIRELNKEFHITEYVFTTDENIIGFQLEIH